MKETAASARRRILQHMPRSLRTTLTALVLVNLAFVLATDRIHPAWLLPLLGLTLASPWLWRWQAGTKRWVWDVAVTAVFAALVHHAFTVGVHVLLQDGLLLAVACQVHLLMTLRPGQRADLVFLTSLQVALVSSFFCQGVTFCLLFVVWTWLLILALRLQAGGAHGQNGNVYRSSAGNALAVLACTFLVFLVWPRDFYRPGLIDDNLIYDRTRSVGFSERVELGRSASITSSDRVVAKLRLTRGQAHQVPVRWRGATCRVFTGQAWRAVLSPQTKVRTTPDQPWRKSGPGAWVRDGHVASARVEVELHDADGVLLAPLRSHGLCLTVSCPEVAKFPRVDGAFGWIPRRGGGGSVCYQVALHEQLAIGPKLHPAPSILQRFLQLPPGCLPVSERATVERLRTRHTEDRQLAMAVQRHLQSSHRYLPPGQRDAAGSLAEFLAEGGSGHCEYFATALALMLRHGGVPTRLVTGYMSNEWDADRQVLTLRSRHAHAWVEAWDAQRGCWFTLDATPAVASTGAVESASVLAAVTGALQRLWTNISGLDADSRRAAFAWLGRQLASLGLLLLVAVGVGLSWWLWQRQQRLVLRSVEDYQRAARRAGLQPATGETPRAFLQRAEQGELPESILTGLRQAVAAHERKRYARG